MFVDGRFLQVDYDQGQLFLTNFKRTSEWKSWQFHFHSPAEHRIDGKKFDAEMHMVFKGVTHPEELAVLGLLFEAKEDAKPNKFLDSLKIEKLKYPKDENYNLEIPLNDLYANLPSYQNYHYHGSLTTGEYNETVQWLVFTEPLQVPPRQLKAMSDFWKHEHFPGCSHGNARDIQKVGSRIIYKIDYVHEK